MKKKTKRARRSRSQIQDIKSKALETVQNRGTVTLSQLISDHGTALGIRDTVSDRQLLKRQLFTLADEGQIRFSKKGSHLVARSKARRGRRSGAIPEVASPVSGEARAEPVVAVSGRPELEAIKAYAAQLEELARTLNDQIARLAKMIREV